MKRSYLLLTMVLFTGSAKASHPSVSDCIDALAYPRESRSLIQTGTTSTWQATIAVAEQVALGKFRGEISDDTLIDLRAGRAPVLDSRLVEKAVRNSWNDGVLRRAQLDVEFLDGSPSQHTEALTPAHGWWSHVVRGKTNIRFVSTEHYLANLRKLPRRWLTELSNSVKSLPPLSLDEVMRIASVLDPDLQEFWLDLVWHKVFTPLEMFPLDRLATILRGTSREARQMLWRLSGFALGMEQVRGLIMQWPHLIREIQQQEWPMGFSLGSEVTKIALPKGSIPLGMVPVLLKWVPENDYRLRGQIIAGVGRNTWVNRLGESGLLNSKVDHPLFPLTLLELERLKFNISAIEAGSLLVERLENAKSLSDAVAVASVRALDPSARLSAIKKYLAKQGHALSVEECQRLAETVPWGDPSRGDLGSHSDRDEVYLAYFRTQKAKMSPESVRSFLDLLGGSSAKREVVDQVFDQTRDQLKLATLESLLPFASESDRDSFWSERLNDSNNFEEAIAAMSKFSAGFALKGHLVSGLADRYKSDMTLKRLVDLLNLLPAGDGAQKRLLDDFCEIVQGATQVQLVSAIFELRPTSSVRSDVVMIFLRGSMELRSWEDEVALFRALAGEASLESYYAAWQGHLSKKLDSMSPGTLASVIEATMDKGARSYTTWAVGIHSQEAASARRRAFESNDQYLSDYVRSKADVLSERDLVSLLRLVFGGDEKKLELLSFWLKGSERALSDTDWEQILDGISSKQGRRDLLKIVDSTSPRVMSAKAFARLVRDLQESDDNIDRLTMLYIQSWSNLMNLGELEVLLSSMKNIEKANKLRLDFLRLRRLDFSDEEVRSMLGSMSGLSQSDREVMEVLLGL